MVNYPLITSQDTGYHLVFEMPMFVDKFQNLAFVKQPHLHVQIVEKYSILIVRYYLFNEK